MASTETLTQQDTITSQYLSRSMASLSRSKSTSSLIVRTYKQATQLYLTKRFKEALDTLTPILSPQQSSLSDSIDHVLNGDQNSATIGVAPVARSSKGTRTKVWVFYLSLLHAIIELGAEQGKLSFASTRWRELAAKARQGTIWEEVIQHGYGGNEGSVDAEVVVNLSTLLLGQMPSQKLNQQRVEAYLAASSAPDGSLSYSSSGMATPMSDRNTSSPKELTSRLKILELYTLHILPANDEWDYSAAFIEMNDTLDEERKEAFLQALHDLRDAKDGLAQREAELEALREQELAEQRAAAAEAKRKADAQREEERRRAAETATARPGSSSARPPAPQASSKPASKPLSSSKPPPPPATKKPPAPPPAPANLYSSASAVFSNIHTLYVQASRSMNMNTFLATRVLLFFAMLLLLLARRNLRERVKKLLGDGWGKVKGTVGMGVKVSYV